MLCRYMDFRAFGGKAFDHIRGFSMVSKIGGGKWAELDVTTRTVRLHSILLRCNPPFKKWQGVR